jgi:hypothetical protein
MTKQEEILKLRDHPNHYLWNVPRNQWTNEDLENLKNPKSHHAKNRKNAQVRRASPAPKPVVKVEPPPAPKLIVISKVKKPQIMTEQYMIYESSMNHIID